MCELEENVGEFTYSYQLWDVLGTPVTLKVYYAIYRGQQKCFYFDRKHNYLILSNPILLPTANSSALICFGWE
jgi:hypothetical protein